MLQQLLKSGLTVLGVFGAVWLAVIGWWRHSGRMPSTSDITTYLLAMPAALLLAYALLGRIIGGIRQTLTAPIGSPKAASASDHAPEAHADGSAGATTDAIAPASIQTAWVTNVVFRSAAGANADAIIGNAKNRQGILLDATLRDANGFPVRTARVRDLHDADMEALQQRLEAGRAGLAEGAAESTESTATMAASASAPLSPPSSAEPSSLPSDAPQSLIADHHQLRAATLLTDVASSAVARIVADRIASLDATPPQPHDATSNQAHDPMRGQRRGMAFGFAPIAVTLLVPSDWPVALSKSVVAEFGRHCAERWSAHPVTLDAQIATHPHIAYEHVDRTVTALAKSSFAQDAPVGNIAPSERIGDGAGSARVAVIAAAYSALSSRAIGSLEAEGVLQTAAHPTGMTAGEAGVALTLSNQAQTPLAKLGRAAFSTPLGDASAATTVIDVALRQAGVTADAVRSLFVDVATSDAVVELAGARAARLPQIDAFDDCVALDSACGHTAAAGALLSVAVACAHAGESGHASIALSLFPLQSRAAIVALPDQFKI